MKSEDYISLDDLRKLTDCQVTSIRNSAMQILFDRAMSSKHLPYLLECCQSEDNVKRKKAMIIVQQLVGSERNRGVLTRKKLPKILVKSLRLDGDPEIHRYAVASLYHLTLDNDKRKAKIVSYGVLDSLIKFLQDEPNRYSDLKFWSISLIHQFSQTDSVSAILIAKKIMNLLTEMVKLNFGNPNVQKLCFHAIVRILSTIDDEDESKQILLELADLKLISLAAGCLRNSDVELASWKLFYKEILKVKLIDKIVKTLQGQEEQTIYWALGLLHMLAFQMPDQKSLFESGALSAMLNIHDSVMLHIHLYVIEIIGVLCTDREAIRFEIVISLIRPLIYKMFSNISLVVNTINSSESKKTVLSPILEDHESGRTHGRPNSRMSNDSYSFSPTRAVAQELPESPVSPQENSFRTNCSKLLTAIECLSILLKSNIFDQVESENHQKFSDYVGDILDDVGTSLLNALVFPLVLTQSNQQVSDELKLEIPKAALECIVNLLYIESFREFVVNESILSILFVLLSDYGSKISKPIIYALPQFVQYNIFREEILYSDTNFSCVLRAVAKLNNEIDWAFFRKFVSRSCDFTAIDYTPTFVSLDQSRSTQFADIEMHSLLCFNRTWTFETAIAKYGVSKPGKWGYEFQLGSAGILQIGWVCSEYTPKEYGGWGVGDDMLSYAFDGARVRKWHGRDVDSDGYGEEWSFRDVVTCLIDFDNGTISYLLNGKDLGIAFENINVNEIWYPAVSLTGEQWGTFLFGGELDKLIFCPTEYLPIPVPELDTFHSTEFLNSSNDLSNVDSEVFYSAPALEVEQTNESPQLQSSANLEENFKRIVERIDGKDKSETTFDPAKEDLNSVTENLFENKELHIATTTKAVQSDEVSTAEMESNITDQIPKSPKRKGKLQITTSANLDICMYYEVETGKIYYERCVHIGYITSPKQIISLVYLPHIQVIYLVKISVAVTDDFLEEDLETILEADAESPLVHVYYKAKISLDHRTVGVGIDSTIDSVFFTFDGKRFGPFVPRNATFCTPYIRDLSRYILNFGQYDFVSQECNHSWSPSTFRNKID
ncbi:hypothetical protein HDV04_002243 [Boothiomyces sp. JEL0838]|nr:hypothetical protein HDV04_002243 [Boothiomyces sp. JEL0838]